MLQRLAPTRRLSGLRQLLAGVGAILVLGTLGATGVSGVNTDQPNNEPRLSAKADALLAEAKASLAVADTAELAAARQEPQTHTHVKAIKMEVTAYCPCTKCCGPKAQGITASGKRIDHNGGRFVAADTNLLPFGTKLLIPGYSEQAVEVIDRGGAIKGHRLDVFFDTHQEALEWGRRTVTVMVIE